MPGVGPLHVKCDLQDLLDAGRITGIVGTMHEMQVGKKFLF